MIKNNYDATPYVIKLLKEIFMSYKVSVVIEKDEFGFYAFCPELDGCQSQGDSLDDVITNIKEAIELYLETLPKNQRKTYLSSEIFTTVLEVKVA